MGLIGSNCKLYRNTGTLESPTMVECVEATGVTITATRTAGDVSGRGDAIKTMRGGRPEYRITGSMAWRASNANIDAFGGAFRAGTSIIVAALDGDDDVTGAEGPHGSVDVIKWDRTEGDDEGVKYDFELVFTDASNFEWLSVSGS